jgi:hypothetical protein
MAKYKYSDGGRLDAGFKGKAGDCVTRAIAIATGRQYREVYNILAKANQVDFGERSARNGIYKVTYERILKEMGFVWHKAPVFIGRKARTYDMPKDKIVIARMAHHIVAVVNGVAHDTYDSTNKMVYGYWAKS